MYKLILSIAAISTVAACNHSSLPVASQCPVPSMYLQVYNGLIDPTWEPEAEMRSQIEGLSENDLVCWYGNRDGSVEARVDQTSSSYRFYIFRKSNDKWLLVDSGESITIS